MLQQIRDRTSGLVAGFIVAIIAIPFAFWGVDSFVGGGGDPVVAEVGDQKIRDSQFRRAYEQRYQQYLSLLGDNFRPEQFDQARFRQRVLEDMTQESMMRQYAQDSGFHANDAVLFETISSIPAFQRDGKFSTEAYREVLSQQGYTADRFEAQLRESIEIDQLRGMVIETAYVTPAQASQAYRLNTQERALSYATFEPARYAAAITVSEDEVKARYEETKAQWQAPERVKLAYVELALSELAPTGAPSGDVLKVLYDAEKASRFTTQEERKASHILVAFGADKDAARKKIDGIAAELKAGKAFADLARAQSDDSGSKAAGGDLGWVKRGQMVEKFEKALYDLKANEISGPVETEFGWHLIRADEVRPSVVRPFEDSGVQAELAELYQGREQQKRFQEYSEKLEQLAFEHPSSLEPAAKELNLTIKTTDWFTRAGGTGVAAQDAVKAAAFSPEVLNDGENSKPLQAGDNRLVVVRKAEHEPARQKPIEEVAEALRTQLRDAAAKAKAKADAEALLAAVRGGQPLAEAVAARGLTLKSPGTLRRDATTEDRALVEALFKLPRGKDGLMSYGLATLGDGSVAMLAFGAVHEPGVDAQQAEASTARLRDIVAGGEFRAYRKQIADEVKVEIVEAPAAETAPAEEAPAP